MHTDELTGMHVQQPGSERLEPAPWQEPEIVEGEQRPSEDRPSLPPGIKAELVTAEPGEAEPFEEGWFSRYRRMFEGRAKRLVLRKQGGAGRLPQSVSRSKSTGLGAVNVRDQGTLLPHEAGVDIGASDNRWDDGWFNRVITKVLGVGTPNPTPRVCHIRSRKDDSYQVRLEGYLNKALGIELFEQPASSGAFVQRATWFAIGSTVYFRVNDGSDVTRFSLTSLGTDIAGGNLYMGGVQIVSSTRNATFVNGTFSGTITVQGSGSSAAGLNPSADNVDDLGTAVLRWSEIFGVTFQATTVNTTNLTASGTVSLPAVFVRTDTAKTYTVGPQDFTAVVLKIKHYSLGSALTAANWPLEANNQIATVWDGTNMHTCIQEGGNKWKLVMTQVT